jgi:hypothetical protein
MKKILALLGALALIGTAAFAQGFEISGSLKTGLAIVSQEGQGAKVDADTVIYGNNDDNSYPLSIDLNFGYTGENYGAKIGLRYRPFDNNAFNNAGGQVQNTTDVFLNYGYAWYDMFNGMVTVTGGKIDGNLWNNVVFSDDGWDAVLGLRVEVKPIEGLSLGFALPLASARDAGTLNMNLVPATAKETFSRFIFGAGYGSDLFTARAAVALNGLNKDGKAWTNDDVKALVGVNVPVGPVAISLDAYINGDLDDNGNTTEQGGFAIAPRVTYNAGQFTAFADALMARVDKNYVDSTSPDNSGDGLFHASPRIHAGYTINDMFGVFGRITLNKVDRIGITDKTGGDVRIRVGADINVVKGVKVTVYDDIRFVGAYEKPKNQFQVNMNYTF